MTEERGQTTILVVGLVLLVFAVTGLAVDGTRAFLFRRTLQSVVDSSAVAAASEISASKYYASGGQDLQLDPARATETARRWLTRRGSNLVIGVRANADEVHILARGVVHPSFLALIGIRSIPVAVEAAARPLPGAAPGG
jgi:Putative Flp pilus-assembly TadE/G-like